jgi:hypothetical protein
MGHNTGETRRALVGAAGDDLVLLCHRHMLGGHLKAGSVGQRDRARPIYGIAARRPVCYGKPNTCWAHTGGNGASSASVC